METSCKDITKKNIQDDRNIEFHYNISNKGSISYRKRHHSSYEYHLEENFKKENLQEENLQEENFKKENMEEKFPRKICIMTSLSHIPIVLVKIIIEYDIHVIEGKFDFVINDSSYPASIYNFGTRILYNDHKNIIINSTNSKDYFHNYKKIPFTEIIRKIFMLSKTKIAIITLCEDIFLLNLENEIFTIIRKSIYYQYIKSLHILPNEQIIPIYYFSSSLEILDPQTGLQKSISHTSAITCITSFLDINNVIWIITGAYDQNVRVLNAETGFCDKTLVGHTEDISIVLNLSQTSLILSVGQGTIRIWDRITGICNHNIIAHQSKINCVLQIDNSQLITGSDDHTMKIWNFHTGICTFILSGHTLKIKHIELLPTKQIVSTSKDKQIKIWTIPKHISGLPKTLNSDLTFSHTNKINFLLPLTDGRLLTHSKDTKIIIWR